MPVNFQLSGFAMLRRLPTAFLGEAALNRRPSVFLASDGSGFEALGLGFRLEHYLRLRVSGFARQELRIRI